MTRKPLSTISYNTECFLRNRLEYLRDNGVITLWCYIHHNPESDTTKDHFHVYLEPSRDVDTGTLQNEFVEPLLDGEKPLGCMHFTRSKLSDWLLYSTHDHDYLRYKELEKKYFYRIEDVISSDTPYISSFWHEIDRREFRHVPRILEAISLNYTAYEALSAGIIRMNEVAQYQRAKNEYQRSLAVAADDLHLPGIGVAKQTH